MVKKSSVVSVGIDVSKNKLDIACLISDGSSEASSDLGTWAGAPMPYHMRKRPSFAGREAA
jgi:hypothetical protein